MIKGAGPETALPLCFSRMQPGEEIVDKTTPEEYIGIESNRS
jgi:hypothetical protein